MEKAILLNHKTIHLRLPLEVNHNILYHCRKVLYTGENRWESVILVCYTAVFSVVTQRSSTLYQWGRALRDDTKNGCVADYNYTGDSEKKNPSSPNRRRTYGLLAISPNALPLSYRRLEGAKVTKLCSNVTNILHTART